MKQIKSRKHLKQPITRISANEPGRWGFTCGHVVSRAEGRLCHGFQVAQVSLTFVQQWQQATYVCWFGVCVMEMATDGNGLLILFESNELAELQLGLKDGF